MHSQTLFLKSNRLWANSNFQNSATFPLLALFFFIVTDNTKTQLFYKHCFCQGGMDFVKSDSSPTVHTNSGGKHAFQPMTQARGKSIFPVENMRGQK
jgi:hypothetical protein